MYVQNAPNAIELCPSEWSSHMTHEFHLPKWENPEISLSFLGLNSVDVMFHFFPNKSNSEIPSALAWPHSAVAPSR